MRICSIVLGVALLLCCGKGLASSDAGAAELPATRPGLAELQKEMAQDQLTMKALLQQREKLKAQLPAVPTPSALDDAEARALMQAAASARVALVTARVEAELRKGEADRRAASSQPATPADAMTEMLQTRMAKLEAASNELLARGEAESHPGVAAIRAETERTRRALSEREVELRAMQARVARGADAAGGADVRRAEAILKGYEDEWRRLGEASRPAQAAFANVRAQLEILEVEAQNLAAKMQTEQAAIVDVLRQSK